MGVFEMSSRQPRRTLPPSADGRYCLLLLSKGITMRTIVLLVLLAGVRTLCVSQTLTVKDRETGHVLEMATLASEAPRAFTTTNAKGQADIGAFEGSERIEIRFLGYKTEIRSYSELQQAGFIVLLSPSVLSFDQIVVSATRWSRPSMDVPARITTVTARSLFLQSPQTAADVLASSGEVFIQKSQQGGGSPMIRGFATNRLLYTVDGVRMNTAIFRAGNLQNVISLDPFATENTEVLFGPGSVIYGSDAIGGVMSFQTLTPQVSLTEQPLTTGKAILRTSSANSEKTGHVDVNLGWAKGASVTSLSSFDYGDLTMGRHGPTDYLRPSYVQRKDGVDVVVTNGDPRVQRPTGYTQVNLMQKLRYQPDKEWDLQYGFHYSTTSDYSRYDRHIQYRNGLPRSAEWYYGPQVWMMNNLAVSHNTNGTIYDQLTVRLAYQFFEESRVDRDMNDSGRRRRIEKVHAYSANFDFNKSVGTGKELFYGLEAVFDNVNSTGTDENIITGAAMPGPARYPQSTWSSYAAYLTYQYKISSQFLIQTGARYNRYLLDARFDTTFYPFPYTTAEMSNGALTGSLGLVYHPTEEWSLSTNVSTGFRSPNVDDAGKVFDSEPGFVIVPNPNLEAEYAYNAEIGAARIFGTMMKIDFTGYYTFLESALVRRNFTLNGLDSIVYDGVMSRVQAVQNAASAHVYGIQAGLEIKLPSGLGFSSHLNYQKGEEELDDGTRSPSRHAAPWFGAFHLTYSAQDLMLDLYTLYNGKKSFSELPDEEKAKDYLYTRDSRGNPYSPAWYTINLKATVQLSDILAVSGGLENITDQRYKPYSSGVAGPGRNFVVSLRAGF